MILKELTNKSTNVLTDLLTEFGQMDGYIKEIERCLYEKAPSLEAYRNLFTLKQRVNHCLEQSNIQHQLETMMEHDNGKL